MNDEIQVVQVLSQGERVAWVITQSGGYIVTPIPDAATRDTLQTVSVLKSEINSVDEAERWFRKEYGL